jgi:transcriptional regulator with XRE-family HTH domain
LYTSSPDGSAAVEIGREIKKLRHRAGLTQEELANRADLTKGFISQVENDATSPSIATLEDIVRALGATLPEFFRAAGERERQVVFRKGDGVVSGESEGDFELIFPIPDAHRNGMEPVVVTLAPGGATPDEEGHEGEEFGYVLAGRVELRLGGATHSVRAGECFYYAADSRHSIVNAGKGQAKLLWVSTPPSF